MALPWEQPEPGLLGLTGPLRLWQIDVSGTWTGLPRPLPPSAKEHNLSKGLMAPSHKMRSPASFSGLLSKEQLQLYLQGTISVPCCCITWACLPLQRPHTTLRAAGPSPPRLLSDQPPVSAPLLPAAWAGTGAPCYRDPVKEQRRK